MNERVPIIQLDTGVPGFNEVLGGGLPEYSFNLLAGSPGAGKTTLVHQMAFSLATRERPALYITVLGEPPLKLLRYQQQFAFFDMTKVNSCIRFMSISKELLEEGLGRVLEKIVSEIEETHPRLVIVDSFRSVIRASPGHAHDGMDMSIHTFVQRLAVHLTTWQATSFLVGEYGESEQENNPIFTVADGVLWLSQSTERHSVVRKLQIIKMRGQAPIPGVHTFRITGTGVQVFPRLPTLQVINVGDQQRLGTPHTESPRLSTGVRGLDQMMGGGIPAGCSILIAGPSGSGKTVLSSQFLAEGVACGEPGLLALFEKGPSEYFMTNPLGPQLGRILDEGLLHMVYLRLLDLSMDETLEEIRKVIIAKGVKRVVIDSLSSFELALAPAFREDFRETLHRMVMLLTAMGVTLLLTVEVADSYIDLRFSPHGTAFLTDGILVQRYIELDGQLQRIMAVVKLRGSQHSKALIQYDITNEGIVIGTELSGFEGLMTGSPRKMTTPTPEN